MKKLEYRIEHVDVDQVRRWPRNPKLHDERGIDESLERFGFTAPLLLDETTGQLVAGHGRLEALLRRLERGQPPPARVLVEGTTWKVPVLRGVAFRDAAEAEAYLVADNRLTEAGGWDEEGLLAMVRDLDGAGVTFEGTGFPADYAARLVDSYDKVPTTGDAKPRPSKFVKCPKCEGRVEIKRGLPGSAVRARREKAQ